MGEESNTDFFIAEECSSDEQIVKTRMSVSERESRVTQAENELTLIRWSCVLIHSALLA
jgi:hypothetical protein